ncbi:MAG: VOC family protein [Halieaceae bacterium]|jgi:hypothetical protein|nr:VOC family protein [Halieaceae bacterium]
MLTLDHLTVTAENLDDGSEYVERCLGARLSPGGQHAIMGTHNRLLGLGPGLYLEVISVDPEAIDPGRSRWFNLDRCSGPSRLSHWAARCDDLALALSQAPTGSGAALALERGDLRWQMAVSDDGRLPWDDLFPALLAWESEAHPSQRLPDSGIRLSALELFHPDAQALRRVLEAMIHEPRLSVHEATQPSLRARFDTPAGDRWL